MIIITLYTVSDAQRKRIAELLGKKVASQDDCRAFMQQEGERTLEALTLPLMGQAPASSKPRSAVTEVAR